MAGAYTIRRALATDVETLVRFTLEEAREAEGLIADPAAVRRGVEAAFVDPPRATYWVVEDEAGRVVASTSIVAEWSDFRGGEYWWIQSIFIGAEHRGRGVLQRLIDHLAGAARAGGALDLRLYVHSSNTRALRAYRRCGFLDAPYTVMTLART